MATITEIKNRIKTLDPAGFQIFCDALLIKEGYGRNSIIRNRKW